ncbi:uncharacterized protein LOC100898192 [Galendromus occidentalis]|uniref:Uncharacterized protein LOC100898192 n=1 Tax=Galendromus occidentalis TaxID=34638 RepID=A0AAJ6QN38_9ACAR|nr:uncharacterized protein LOC100898192 [Galendromus occidentalis]
MQMLTNRGGRKLAHDGFLYNFDKYSADGGTLYWRCEPKGRCNGRVHTIDGDVVRTINEHTHDSDPARIQTKQAVAEIKARAQETMEGCSQVINATLLKLPEYVMGVMPTKSALKKTVQNARGERFSAPAAPTSSAELSIPEGYRTYETSPGVFEDFLLADSGPELDRILIFGRSRNIEELRYSKMWFVDGTFSIVPPLFYQVYVILAEMNQTVHPFLYVLLPNKSGSTYTRMFTMIRSLDESIEPETISCDYELAAINSIREVFPNANIAGCYFHLMQNLKKHVNTSGLTTKYRNDPEFASYAKMIGALAYVPPQDVEKAFELLSEESPAELEPLLNYFEDTYLGRPDRRGRRRNPRFPISIWNVYERTIQGCHRTNNHAEAANRRIQTEFNMDHPSIWMFIDALKRSQKNRDFEYESLVAGAAGPTTLKKYEVANRNTLRLVSSYTTRTTMSFLRGITYNYQKKN